jgi:hypothetical protein
MEVATSGAPGTGEGTVAPAPVVTPAPIESTGNPIRDAARALSAARWQNRDKQAAPSSEAPEADAPVAEPAPESPQGESAAPPDQEAPGEQQTQADEPEAETLPPIEPPRSWTKDEQERFKTFPRELQAYLSEREQERDRDLRRRQNEAAEARKAIEAEQAAAAKARQEYEAKIPQLLQTLQQQQASEFADIRTHADLQRMAAEDPVRYLKWDAHQKQLSAVAEEAQAAHQRQVQEAVQSWQKFCANEDKLIADKLPDLADPAKAPKLRESAVKVLTDHGFTEQELAEAWNGQLAIPLRDHRIQLLIHDAVKWREAQAAAQKVTATPKPPVQRPGTAQTRPSAAEAEIQALQQKLDQTGSLRDAAALRAAQLRTARKA